MYQKTDSSSSSTSSTPEPQLQAPEAELEKVYQQFSISISRLFDLVDSSYLNKEIRIDTIKNMRDLFNGLNRYIPNEAINNKKGPYEFSDVAKTIAYSERWYESGKSLTEDQALAKTAFVKHSFQVESGETFLGEFIDILKQKAADKDELTITDTLCKAAVNCLNQYKQLLVTFYFSNDPYEHGKELKKEDLEAAFPEEDSAPANDLAESQINCYQFFANQEMPSTPPSELNSPEPK